MRVRSRLAALPEKTSLRIARDTVNDRRVHRRNAYLGAFSRTGNVLSVRSFDSDSFSRAQTMLRLRVSLLASTLTLSVASIIAPTHARALEVLTSTTCAYCTWSSALESADVAAPRDLLDAVKRAEQEMAACGLGGFLDAIVELGGTNASMDIVRTYSASKEFCSRTSDVDVVKMQTKALAPARRVLVHLEVLARHVRACSAPIFEISREDDAGAVELLRTMASESFRVISSGRCYADTTRLTASSQGTIDTRRFAQQARRLLLDQLHSAELTYIEDAFYNETVERDVTSAFASYDICRSSGILKSTVSDGMFDALRAHYTALDFVLTGLSGGGSNKTSGARTFMFLINAAHDVLRSAESCREATKILPGRYFVSDVWDTIMSELSLECGLATTGLNFLDVYSRGHGSFLLSLEITEISRHVALCQSGNTTAKTSMFGLNERAMVELIGGLEMIDASMVGCRRGRDESTAAKRLAKSLVHALRTFRERRCFFSGATGEAAVAAAATIPEYSAFYSTTPITEPIKVHTKPTLASAILSATMTTIFVLLAAFLVAIVYWTYLRAKGISGRRYERFTFDAVDENKATTRPSTASPERGRRTTTIPTRTRRSSFCAGDAISRTKSLDPYLHFS